MQFKNVFSLLFLVVIVTKCDFLPQRLRIIDSYKNNFIVRGNLPIKNKQFQIIELNQQLKNLTKLKKFNLVVISLLNFLTPKQTINNYIQQKFFQNNPQQGAFQRRMILGSLINPKSVPLWLRGVYTTIDKAIGFDNIDNLVDQLRDYLLYGTQPTVVYVHCSAGVDRTGYVSGAYNLKYKKRLLPEIISENLEVVKGFRNHLHFNTLNGLKWYCLSLGYKDADCKI